MPTLDEARQEATKLAAAGAVYRVFFWLLGFAGVDLLTALARLGLTAAGVGADAPMVLPHGPSDYLATLGTPLGAALMAIVVAGLVAKAALLGRIIFVEGKSELDPIWMPWVAAVVAVGCWVASGGVAVWDSMWSARISTEYLATRAVASQVSGIVSGFGTPLLWVAAAVASFYRLQAVTDGAKTSAGPYRDHA